MCVAHHLNRLSLSLELGYLQEKLLSLLLEWCSQERRTRKKIAYEYEAEAIQVLLQQAAIVRWWSEWDDDDHSQHFSAVSTLSSLSEMEMKKRQED